MGRQWYKSMFHALGSPIIQCKKCAFHCLAQTRTSSRYGVICSDDAFHKVCICAFKEGNSSPVQQALHFLKRACCLKGVTNTVLVLSPDAWLRLSYLLDECLCEVKLCGRFQQRVLLGSREGEPVIGDCNLVCCALTWSSPCRSKLAKHSLFISDNCAVDVLTFQQFEALKELLIKPSLTATPIQA